MVGTKATGVLVRCQCRASRCMAAIVLTIRIAKPLWKVHVLSIHFYGKLRDAIPAQPPFFKSDSMTPSLSSWSSKNGNPPQTTTPAGLIMTT